MVRLGSITRLLWYWYTAVGMLDVPQCCRTGAGHSGTDAESAARCIASIAPDGHVLVIKIPRERFFSDLRWRGRPRCIFFGTGTCTHSLCNSRECVALESTGVDCRIAETSVSRQSVRKGYGSRFGTGTQTLWGFTQANAC